MWKFLEREGYYVQPVVNVFESAGASAHHVERVGVDVRRLQRVDLHVEL